MGIECSTFVQIHKWSVFIPHIHFRLKSCHSNTIQRIKYFDISKNDNVLLAFKITGNSCKVSIFRFGINGVKHRANFFFIIGYREAESERVRLPFLSMNRQLPYVFRLCNFPFKWHVLILRKAKEWIETEMYNFGFSYTCTVSNFLFPVGLRLSSEIRVIIRQWSIARCNQ